VDWREAEKAVTTVNMNENTMSTMVQSLKKRRYDGLYCPEDERLFKK